MSDMTLLEPEVSAGVFSMSVNGAKIGETQFSVPNFIISRLGMGNSAGDQFSGKFGEFIIAPVSVLTASVDAALLGYLSNRNGKDWRRP